MKSFLKLTLAGITACFISLILIVALIVAIAAGIRALPAGTFSPQPGTVLHLTLDGNLEERASSQPIRLLEAAGPENAIGLDNLLQAIQNAGEATYVSGIFLELNGLSGGYASIEELRSALSDFRKTGKFVIAYADGYSQKEYYLATCADSILLNPVGTLELNGITAERVFYKGSLEKLGVDIQVFRVGTYKSAVEPFTRTGMSDGSREQTRQYIASIWEIVRERIALSRGLEPDSVNAYANRLLLLQDPGTSRRLGLTDSLLYRRQALELVTKLAGAENIEKLNLASPDEINGAAPARPQNRDKIAVVYAVGEIDNSVSLNEGIHTRKLVRNLYRIKADSTVKGVVLRINSPGGSAFGSEQVWAAVEELKTSKPVAVSMGDYAASGGYYIACNADRIFAQPTTLTGSIGIFGMIPNAGKLLTDKLGLSFDEVGTNRFGDFPSLHKPLSAFESKQMQAAIERGYALFIRRCAEGRHLSPEQVESVAEGRVWSGRQALELGLVDELGELNACIAWMADRCGLETYTLTAYPRQREWWESWLDSFKGNISAWFRNAETEKLYRLQRLLETAARLDPVQARMEDFEID